VIALVVAALLAAPQAASLAGAGKPAPVKVDADAVHYRFQQRQVEFKGNPVRLTRDDAVLTCRRLLAQNDGAGRIRTATCEGDVRFERGEREVTCDRATFDNAASRLTCDGSPVLKDGASIARGVKLVYDLTTDEVSLDKPVITIPDAQLGTQGKALEARRRERKEAGK
jgi:lipopolysaccharide export system protein LptA